MQAKLTTLGDHLRIQDWYHTNSIMDQYLKKWLKENCEGFWYFSKTYGGQLRGRFYFENEEDYIKFILKYK